MDDRKPDRARPAGLIDWVFIDVGNVLFNDDPQNFHAYRLMHETIELRHPNYTFDDMLTERESRACRGEDFILSAIAHQFLRPEEAKTIFHTIRKYLIETYDQNNLQNPGVVPVLDTLRSRWRLGILANQPPECRNSLTRRGLLNYFDVVAISDELGLHKPDVGLYEWAILQSGCNPSRAVMIGDRRDNDISPASRLSMRTILVHWPECRSRGWNPDDPQAQAFLDSCDRVPLFSAVPVGPEPDCTVHSLAEIPAALTTLAEGRRVPPR